MEGTNTWSFRVGAKVVAFVAVVTFLIVLVRAIQYDADLRQVDTAIIEEALPARAYVDDPNLTISEKQSYAISFGNVKGYLKEEVNEIRDWDLTVELSLAALGLVLCLVFCARMVRKGKELDLAEADAVEAKKVADELALTEFSEDRKGNPFKKGAVSDIVLPRGELWKKRNKFRKTVERPNSDGY